MKIAWIATVLWLSLQSFSGAQGPSPSFSVSKLILASGAVATAPQTEATPEPSASTPTPYGLPESTPSDQPAEKPRVVGPANAVVDDALYFCIRAVRDNEQRRSAKLHGSDETWTDYVMATLDGKVHVATCLLKRNQPRATIAVLRNALKAKSMPTNGEDGIEPEWATAYLRLAQAEYAIGRRGDARKHIAIAVRLNSQLMEFDQVPEMSRESVRIAPDVAKAHRLQLAKDYASETSRMSADQRQVYRLMGPPAHVSTFNAGWYNQETWWYGLTRYYAAYTFRDGRLTSIYRP